MNTPFKMCNKHLCAWIYIVLLNMNFQGSYCQFVITPRNTWAYVDQSVTLDCTIENAGTPGHLQAWREYITDSGGQVISSNEEAFDGKKYEIVDQFNLNIKAVELNDGGTYSCEDALENRVAYKADVVILQSDPTMTSSISGSLVMENTKVQYSCKISYQGKLIPVMEWQNSDGESVAHSDRSTSGYVETSIVITAGPSNNGYSYSCQTYFKDRTATETYQASNTITYSHLLSTSTLEVHYKSRDTQIVDLNDNPINRGSNILAGTQLRCKSDSNPPPRDYVWTNIGEQQVVSTDSIYRIGEDLIGELSLACAVTNYMGLAGQVEETDIIVVLFNVIGSDSSGTNGGGTNEGNEAEKPLSNGEIIGIALGVAVFLAVVIVVTIILVHRRHYKIRKKKIIEEIRINEDGEEEIIRRIEEIVEPAGLPDSSSAVPPDGEIIPDNDTEHDINSTSGSSHSVHSNSMVTDNDGTDVKLNQNRAYTNSNVSLYADNVSEGPPPYDGRNNLGTVF